MNTQSDQRRDEPSGLPAVTAQPLVGQVAVVTGASRGIGRAIALLLAAQGAAVGINYHSQEGAAQAVADTITAAGGQALLLRGDVSSEADVEQMMELAAEKLGPVSILINNAGIVRDSLLLGLFEEDWNSVIDTNLKSVYLCTRAVLSGMLRLRHGRIISISSAIGLQGNPGQTNYAAAKAGMIGFTRSLAREVARRGITANVVAPGLVTTEILQDMTEEAHTRIMATIPMGRPGESPEIASAVAFLASDAASYITGQVLSVDGGMVMA